VRYDSKIALLTDIEREFAALSVVLDQIPFEQYLQCGVWGDSWNVRDLVAHLFEWQQLFLGWFDAGARGFTPEIPAAGFRYREIPQLNRNIQLRYATYEPREIRQMLESSHQQLLSLAASLTQEQLLQPGAFAWTKRNALVTYLGPNTSSHYRFALKVLKRWLRTRSAPEPAA
jgi:hypothetical protein